jgi:endonuclease YncB( thermonuclease family)
LHPHPPVPPPPGRLARVWTYLARRPRKVVVSIAAAGLVGLVGIGSLANAKEPPASRHAAVSAPGPAALAPTTPVPVIEAPTPPPPVPPPTPAPPAPAVAPTTLAPVASTTPTPAPVLPAAAPALTVRAVVDGDTVDLSDGERVRIIGIDTPERGQPGHTEAAAAMSAMVLGRQVVLSPGARQDRDRYGRLLRYLDVDGQDVGLAMISQGWAIARYDSRDGYGHHSREATYIAADQASGPSYAAAPAPPLPAPAPIGPTDQRFSTCRAAKTAGFGPYVSGLDPEYGWYKDADHDGVVCE